MFRADDLFRSLRLVSTAVLSGAIVLGSGCGRETPGERVERAVDLLPPDVPLAVTVTDLAALGRHLELGTFAERRPRLFARASTAIENAVSVNLLDPDSARVQGLDPGRPIAFALLAEPEGATLLVLPGDAERLLARLERVYRRRGAAPNVAITHEGVDVHVADRAAACYMALGDHVVVLSGVTRPDERVMLCRRLIDGAGRNALSRSERYESVMARLSAEADVTCYLAPRPDDAEAPVEGIVPELTPFLGFARLSGGHDGAGLSARVHADRLVLGGFARVESAAEALGARPRDQRSADPFLERLTSRPIFALQLNVDLTTLWAKLRSMHEPPSGEGEGERAEAVPPEDADERHAGMRETHERLLGSLSGRIGLLASRVALIGSDIVLYAEGTDAPSLSAALDTLVAGLRRDPAELPMLGSTASIEEDVAGGVPFYRLSLLPFAEVCAGVVADHLIVTTTRARLEEIVEGRSSFLEHIPDASVRRALTDGHMVAAYVDIAGILGAFGTMPIPHASEYRSLMGVIDSFQHVTCVGDVDDEGYATEIKIVASGADVWPGLIEALIAERGRTS